MLAIVAAGFESTTRLQLDTVVRCVYRDGQIVKCLASVGFHADPVQGEVYLILRLWPLGFRSMAVLPVPGEVNVGFGGGARESSLLGRRWREGKRDEMERSVEVLPVAGWQGERTGEEEGSRQGADNGGPYVYRPIVPSPGYQQHQQEQNEREEEEEYEEDGRKREEEEGGEK